MPHLIEVLHTPEQERLRVLVHERREQRRFPRGKECPFLRLPSTPNPRKVTEKRMQSVYNRTGLKKELLSDAFLFS